jgi:hypothetical protein
MLDIKMLIYNLTDSKKYGLDFLPIQNLIISLNKINN